MPKNKDQDVFDVDVYVNTGQDIDKIKNLSKFLFNQLNEFKEKRSLDGVFFSFYIPHVEGDHVKLGFWDKTKNKEEDIKRLIETLIKDNPYLVRKKTPEIGRPGGNDPSECELPNEVIIDHLKCRAFELGFELDALNQQISALRVAETILNKRIFFEDNFLKEYKKEHKQCIIIQFFHHVCNPSGISSSEESPINFLVSGFQII